MDHPVEPPLGRLVTLTAGTWESEIAPAPGQWLRTEKGRTSYEVVEIRKRRTNGYVLRCRRWRRGQEPMAAATAQWFLWSWASRERRRA